MLFFFLILHTFLEVTQFFLPLSTLVFFFYLVGSQCSKRFANSFFFNFSSLFSWVSNICFKSLNSKTSDLRSFCLCDKSYKKKYFRFLTLYISFRLEKRPINVQSFERRLCTKFAEIFIPLFARKTLHLVNTSYHS